LVSGSNHVSSGGSGGGSLFGGNQARGGNAQKYSQGDDIDINPSWSEGEDEVPVSLRKPDTTQNFNAKGSTQNVNYFDKGRDNNLQAAPPLLALDFSLQKRRVDQISIADKDKPQKIENYAPLAKVGGSENIPETASLIQISEVSVDQHPKKKRLGRILGFDQQPRNISSRLPTAGNDKHLQSDVNFNKDWHGPNSAIAADINREDSLQKAETKTMQNASVPISVAFRQQVASLIPKVGVLENKPVVGVGESNAQNRSDCISLSKEDLRSLKSMAQEMLNLYTKFATLLLSHD